LQPNLTQNLKKWNSIERYSRWIFSKFKTYAGKRILDIGAGIGSITQYFVDDAEFVLATDIFENQLSIITERFRGCNIKTLLLNIETDDIKKLKQYNFDTIVCINVLEHLENDLNALLKMKDIVASGGRIIIMVPAGSKLFNNMDKSAGHHRRYDKEDLKRLAEKAELKIIYHSYFNMFGILPYYLKGRTLAGENGAITYSSTLNNINSKFYNFATVLLEPVERIFNVPFGLSEIVVLEQNRRTSCDED
jgi:SAM-dependent methyltransferase